MRSGIVRDCLILMMETWASEGAERAQLHLSIPHFFSVFFPPFLSFSLPSPLLWAGRQEARSPLALNPRGREARPCSSSSQ